MENRPSFRRAWLDPLVRRLLHSLWRFSRALTVGVRAAVIDSDGRVFLVKHSYVSGWHLPGGGVEPGETVMAALVRELAEEGNIVPTAPPVLHGIFFNAHVSRRDHVALFVVRAFRRDGPPRDRVEIIDCGFFHPDALPPDTTAGTRTRLAEIFDAQPVAEEW
jgi:8-oxo-dGTP pyrophosphatase MutT (NUDIX family)